MDPIEQDAFEIRVDCPFCKIEGARLEIWSEHAPCCALGVPARARCRGCGGVGVGEGAELTWTTPPTRYEDAGALEAALARWAVEEDLASARELIEACFVLPSLPEIFAAYQRGEVIETSFDVADYLFGGGAATTGPATMEAQGSPLSVRPPNTQRMPRAGGAREELLALASIAAADGDAGGADHAALARAAERRGVPPLSPEELRVWRPNELAAPPTLTDRERMLEEMFQLAWGDGQLDESELRVIRNYARAWGIDPVRMSEWTELYALADRHPIARWLGRFAHFLFPAD